MFRSRDLVIQDLLLEQRPEQSRFEPLVVVLCVGLKG